MLSDGYRRRKSRSPRMAKKSRSRKVKRSRSSPRKVKRSRSAPRRRSRSASRKVKRSRSAPRRRSRSAPRRVRSRSRRRLTPEEKLMRKAKVISKALENCKKYGMNSDECLKTMRVISKPARDNIREIIRKLDEQKMKILTAPEKPIRPINLDLIRRIRQGPSPVSGGMRKCNIVGRWLNENRGVPRNQQEYIDFVIEQKNRNNLTKSEIDYCLESLNARVRHGLMFDPKKVSIDFKKIDKSALLPQFVQMRNRGVPAGALALKMNAAGFSNEEIKKFEEEGKKYELLTDKLLQNSKEIINTLGLSAYKEAASFIRIIVKYLNDPEKQEIISAEDSKVAGLVRNYVTQEQIKNFKDSMECANKDVINEIKEAFPLNLMSMDTLNALFKIFPERIQKKCKFSMDEIAFNSLVQNSGIKTLPKGDFETELKKLLDSKKITQKIYDANIAFEKYDTLQKITLLRGFEENADSFNKNLTTVFNNLDKDNQDQLLKELNIKKDDIKGDYNWYKILGGVAVATAVVGVTGYLIYTGQINNPIPPAIVEGGKDYVFKAWNITSSGVTDIASYGSSILNSLGTYFGFITPVSAPWMKEAITGTGFSGIGPENIRNVISLVPKAGDVLTSLV